MPPILGTLLTALLLAALVGLIVFSLRRDRKKGKHICGGSCGSGACAGCSGCSMSAPCHHAK